MEKEVNNIFKDAIILFLQAHVVDYTHLAFYDMMYKLLEKEKVLVKLRLVKCRDDDKSRAKEKKPQSPKKEKSIHVVENSYEMKERKFINFPIPPSIILKYLMAKGLL